jgi:hypothetical protein
MIFGYKEISACKIDLKASEINMTKVYGYKETCNSLLKVSREQIKYLVLNVLQRE